VKDHLSLALEPMKRKQTSSANESYAVMKVDNNNLLVNVRTGDAGTRRVAHDRLLHIEHRCAWLASMLNLKKPSSLAMEAYCSGKMGLPVPGLQQKAAQRAVLHRQQQHSWACATQQGPATPRQFVWDVQLTMSCKNADLTCCLKSLVALDLLAVSHLMLQLLAMWCLLLTGCMLWRATMGAKTVLLPMWLPAKADRNADMQIDKLTGQGQQRVKGGLTCWD
jgi:hypothetical protein